MKKSKFNTNRYLSLISAIVIAIIFTVASSAHATLEIRLTQGGAPPVVITDESSGDKNLGVVGSVSWSGQIGVFHVDVCSGTSKPYIGSATDPEMHLISMETTSNQPGTLTVEVTDTDYGPLSPGMGFLTMVNGTDIGSEVQFDAYDDTTNLPYGPQTTIASDHFYASAGQIWNGAYPYNGPTSSPFSLTMKADIIHTKAGMQTTQFDAVTSTTPEPGTILLLGLGLLGIGIIGKKKREKA